MMGLAAWFADRGFDPFPFQQAVWQAMAEGRSGVLHANTGAGKTLAVWGGVLTRALAARQTEGPRRAPAPGDPSPPHLAPRPTTRRPSRSGAHHQISDSPVAA